tara:strand:+ start:61 stop:924 length:864 start_codon:yes stop_codon:yes gene_type:complete
MIFVSTSGFKNKKISEIVEILAINKFKNIELSGGSTYYEGVEDDLVQLKIKYNLKLQLHNYFPPPKDDFVLNLSSNNDEIFDRSIDHYKRSIEMSKRLGSNKFALHAGYLVDPDVSELGKKIKKKIFNKRSIGIEKFSLGYNILKNFAGDEFDIYVENNVISKSNYENFLFENPLLFTDFNSYLELKEKLDFKILLDIAHLKVSCNSLNLNFFEEFKKLSKLTDYFHISGNDNISDSNQSICNDDDLNKLLKNFDVNNKVLTLEVYSGIKDIVDSYEYLNNSRKKFL